MNIKLSRIQEQFAVCFYKILVIRTETLALNGSLLGSSVFSSYSSGGGGAGSYSSSSGSGGGGGASNYSSSSSGGGSSSTNGRY